MEPYPKSLGSELHSDAIVVGYETEDNCGKKVLFIPYEGIAPHRFHDFFALIGDRKDSKGRFLVKQKSEQALEPKFAMDLPTRIRSDEKQLDTISSFEYKNLIDLTELIKEKE